MARLEGVRVAVPVVVGLVDIVARTVDGIMGWYTPFLNATDLIRTGEVIGGAIGVLKDVKPDITEPMLLGAEPLLIQSLENAVRRTILPFQGYRLVRAGSWPQRVEGLSPQIR
ncbi:MAG: hypothetical protein QW587_04640 [Candidatus Bathyarchaeia archaeon]